MMTRLWMIKQTNGSGDDIRNGKTKQGENSPRNDVLLLIVHFLLHL